MWFGRRQREDRSWYTLAMQTLSAVLHSNRKFLLFASGFGLYYNTEMNMLLTFNRPCRKDRHMGPQGRLVGLCLSSILLGGRREQEPMQPLILQEGDAQQGPQAHPLLK